MEEDVNGINNSTNNSTGVCNSNSMGSTTSSQSMELDQTSSQSSIKPSQKIITDCC